MSKILTRAGLLGALAMVVCTNVPAQAQDRMMERHAMHRAARHEMHREMRHRMMRHEMRHEMRRAVRHGY